MRYRKLSATGDYVFGHGGADFLVNSPEAVAQSVLTRLKLFQGEWFLDVTEGTPYMTQVLGYNTAATRDQALKQRILGTQNVKQILQYSSSFDPVTRAFSVSATVETDFGTASLTL